MASVTRTPMCRVKVCPRPNDPWFHECEVCESPAVHHHHRIPKGMGGSKKRDVPENIIMLCHKHHEQAHGIGAPTVGGEGTAVVPSGDKPSLPTAGASALGRNPPASDASPEERGTTVSLPRLRASVPSLEVKPW